MNSYAGSSGNNGLGNFNNNGGLGNKVVRQYKAYLI